MRGKKKLGFIARRWGQNSNTQNSHVISDKKSDAPRLLVPKGPVAAQISAFTQFPCTVPAQQKIGMLCAMKIM